MLGRTEQHQHPDPYNPTTDPATGLPPTPYQPERKLSNAALRRELWRDNPQQSVEDHADISKGYSQPGGPNNPLLQVHQHPNPFQLPTTQQQQQHLSPHDRSSSNASLSPGEVFKFDSFDRDRYLPRGVEETVAPVPPGHFFLSHHAMGLGHASFVVQPPQVTHSPFCTTSFHQYHPYSLGSRFHNPEEIGEDVFTPASGRSPHSSLSSPQVSVESPRVCFSPLKIKDSIEEEDETGLVIHRLPRLSVRACDGDEPSSLGYTPALGRGVHVHLANSHHQVRCYEQRLLPGHGRSALSRSISPNPTVSYQTSASRQFQSQEENFKRRCMSDTDLSRDLEERMVMVMVKDNYHHMNPTSAHLQSHMLRPQKGGSLESEGSSVQDSPLDLSIRSSISSTTSTQSFRGATLQTTLSFENIPKKRPGRGRGRGRSRSTNFGRGASSLSGDRLSLERFEESSEAGTPPLQYNCNHCEQVFSMANRLAKHMSSRHKSRSVECINKLPHICEICNRCFSRSDMLTRHMRLHTGVKPYPCKICNQVFSRSDHLSTHQRTHTGEKPYNCPSCLYSACRRDMITRHMKTHETQSTSLDHDSSDMDRIGVRRSSIAARSRSHESERPVFGMYHQFSSDADRRKNLSVLENSSAQPE